MKSLTVGELKEALKDVPNDTIVRLTSDTGVDQGEFPIVVESASYNTYYDFFDIYANEEEDYEEEE